MNSEHQEQVRKIEEKIDSCMDGLKEQVVNMKSHVIGEEQKVEFLTDRFDEHLKIYAANGKELTAVKTNQAWLMKLFWIFMTPIASGIIYLVVNSIKV